MDHHLTSTPRMKSVFLRIATYPLSACLAKAFLVLALVNSVVLNEALAHCYISMAYLVKGQLPERVGIESETNLDD